MRNMPQNKLAKLKSYNISVLARTQEGTDHRYKRFLKMEKVSKTWKQNWGVVNKCGQIIISLKRCKKMREKQVGYHVQLRTPRSREQCKLMGKSGEVHPKKWGGAPRRRRDGWKNWEQEKSKTANSDKSIYQKEKRKKDRSIPWFAIWWLRWWWLEGGGGGGNGGKVMVVVMVIVVVV